MPDLQEQLMKLKAGGRPGASRFRSPPTGLRMVGSGNRMGGSPTNRFAPTPKMEADRDTTGGWIATAIGVAEIIGGAVTANPALIAQGVTTAAGGVGSVTGNVGLQKGAAVAGAAQGIGGAVSGVLKKMGGQAAKQTYSSSRGFAPDLKDQYGNFMFR